MPALGIRLDAVSKRFNDGGSVWVDAVVDVSVSVGPGEFVAVVGANGSGKTTLLDLIAGEIDPTTGRVFATDSGGDHELTPLAKWQRAAAPFSFGRVRQDPKAGTVGDLSILDNLRLARLTSSFCSPLRWRPSKTDEQAFSARLARTGLGSRSGARASELSGGQRQILAVEMALLRDPGLLLLDEHTASLDRRNAARCMAITSELCRISHVTVIMVTHNFADAIQYADRVIVLRDGRLVGQLEGDTKRATSVATLVELCGLDSPTPEREDFSEPKG